MSVETNNDQWKKHICSKDWLSNPSTCNKRVRSACTLLLSDLSTVPSLGDLVRSIGTNRNTLTREFNNIFGMSIYAWLREQRLLRAMQLLSETDWSVSKISDAVGYSDSNHFSTSYKKRFGLSPRQQRKPSEENKEFGEGNKGFHRRADI